MAWMAGPPTNVVVFQRLCDSGPAAWYPADAGLVCCSTGLVAQDGRGRAQVADVCLEGSRYGSINLEAKVAQAPAQVHFKIVQLGLEQLVGRQPSAGARRR